MRIRSGTSRREFGRLVEYSHILSVTKTGMRRREERPSRGLCYLLREMPVRYSTTLSIHRKLARIIAKLEPLSKKHGIAKFLKNADHASILNGFVQDLAYAVTDYQVWLLTLSLEPSNRSVDIFTTKYPRKHQDNLR